MMRGRSGDIRGWQELVRLVVVLIVCVASSLSTVAAQDVAAQLEDTLIKVVERAEPAVVSIARFKPTMAERLEAKHRAFGFGNRDDRPLAELDVLPNEFGAGFLISPANSSDRLILTNFHVVRGGPIYPEFRTEDDTELRIHFSDRRGTLGAIIAADPRSDLAVLRLAWDQSGIKPTDFPSLNWEAASAPRKGQFVVLLGNPHAIARDGSASISWGLVSNLTRQPITLNRGQLTAHEELTNNSMLYRLGVVMQLDARLNLGTSGGPVLNLKGELIGISTSLAALEGYEQSVGFAIPIDPLTRRIIRTLLAGQEVEYGMLGVAPEEIDGENFLNLNTGLPQRSAASIKSVTPGSPADSVQIAPGDVIVKVEDQPVRSVGDLMRLVGLHPPGSEINVTLWRGGIRRLDTAKVKLGKWPVRDEEGIIETKPRFAPWRGISIDYPTARDRHRPESLDFRTVLVTKVAEGTPGHAARLEPGNFITHVNNTPVQTPAEFYAAVKSVTGSVVLKLADDNRGVRSGRVVVVRE